MIQIGSYLNVRDNSGAKSVYCIGFLKKQKFSYLGDIIQVVVKRLRRKRRRFSKLKKGDLVRALIIRSKLKNTNIGNNSIKFYENSVVLLSKSNKLLGTRIFGLVPKTFRYTKYMKILSLAKGVK